MMVFRDVDLITIRSHAERLLADLRVAMAVQQKEEWIVGRIMEELKEFCSIGRFMALDEVCATPWEFISQPIMTDAARNDTVMNQMSSQGWELDKVSSHWLFWRRRKAVREIEDRDYTKIEKDVAS